VGLKIIFVEKKLHNALMIDVLIFLGGVTSNMITLSEVDRGFEPKTIKLLFAATMLSMQH
jgi:hypothetical protein